MEYYEYIIDEILKMVKDNLVLIYKYDDEALMNIRKYCLERADEPYKKLDNFTLIYFTEEALADLINVDFWYDLRDME